MGRIEFIEGGFILHLENGNKEIWKKGSDSSYHFIYLHGERYKWVNQPKKSDDLDEDED